jgi:hypothetical protein
MWDYRLKIHKVERTSSTTNPIPLNQKKNPHITAYSHDQKDEALPQRSLAPIA